MAEDKFTLAEKGGSAAADDKAADAGHLKAAVYGVINAVVVMPVMIGFVIFRHPTFHTDPPCTASSSSSSCSRRLCTRRASNVRRCPSR